MRGGRLLAGIVAASLILGFSLATLAWSLYAYTLLARYESLYENIAGGLAVNATVLERLARLYREALRLRPLLVNASRLMEEVNVTKLESLVSEARRLLYSPEVETLEELLSIASAFSPRAERALRMIREARALVSEAQVIVEKLRGLNVSMVVEAARLLEGVERVLPPQKLEKIAALLEELNADRLGGLLERDRRVLGLMAGFSAASSVASAIVLALLLRRARLAASQ